MYVEERKCTICLINTLLKLIGPDVLSNSKPAAWLAKRMAPFSPHMAKLLFLRQLVPQSQKSRDKAFSR